jgi:prepilin signal peptidase PulO-like enzyme (type II secretory pathway)
LIEAALIWAAAPVNLVLLFLIVAAVIDLAVRWIPDTLTAVAAGALAASAFHADITVHQVIIGALCGVLAFLVYVELGVRGIFGGGDIKLVAIPAFILGAVHPLLALWWFTASIGLQGLLSIGNRALKLPAGVPHVPAMAITFAAASCFAAIF